MKRISLLVFLLFWGALNTAFSQEQKFADLGDFKLESGEVPLDDSISLYERGELLRKHCQARLDAAQARIEKIVAGPDGKAIGTEPFDAG